MVELLNTNEEETLDDRVTTIIEEDADGNIKNIPVEMRVYLPSERVAARVLATGKVIQMHWRAGTERYDTEINGKIYLYQENCYICLKTKILIIKLKLR